MKAHNIMEEIIATAVDEYFNNNSNLKSDQYCSCQQCKTDINCYVLNRIKPKYAVSARVIVHHDFGYQGDLQTMADIIRLIKEAFSIVNSQRRGDLSHAKTTETTIENGFFYNFPNITGKILDGETFVPISDVQVKLLVNNSEKNDILVKMMPYNENPVNVKKQTNGIFAFLPYPVETDKKDVEKNFIFKIIINHPNYMEYIKLFDINIPSKEEFQNSIHFTNTKTLEEIFLFPKKTGCHVN